MGILDYNAIGRDFKKHKNHLGIGLGIMVLSFLLPVVTNGKSNVEDGLIEYMTALLLLTISIFFLILFIRKKHFINVLFFLAFFFAFGEEISWGQRIIGFDSPAFMESNNLQGEFTIHNHRIFNKVDVEGNPGRGLNINVLFALFCVGYGVILPGLNFLFRGFRKITDYIGLDIPPLSIGFLFIIKTVASQLLFSGNTYRDLRIGESSELISVFILFIISFTFVFERKDLKALA